MDRELTRDERHLIRWMLERSGPEAQAFLQQLERAKVTPWRCKCGCASFNLSIEGLAKVPGGFHPIADFTFGEGNSLGGILVYEVGGVLGGVEVCGLGGDAPKTLPVPESLRVSIAEE